MQSISAFEMKFAAAAVGIIKKTCNLVFIISMGDSELLRLVSRIEQLPGRWNAEDRP